MHNAALDPNNKKTPNSPRFSDADTTPRSEGGEESLAEASPTDSRADEKVIVNEQESNRTVNRPSQADLNSSDAVVND